MCNKKCNKLVNGLFNPKDNYEAKPWLDSYSKGEDEVPEVAGKTTFIRERENVYNNEFMI